MKTKNTYIIKGLIIILFLLLNFNIFSQNINPLENLDLTEVTSGVFIPSYQKFPIPNALSEEFHYTTKSDALWTMSKLSEFEITNTSFLSDYEVYKNQISSLIESTHAIPISIINYKFHTIKADAEENGLLELIEDFYTDISGANNSPFEERSSMMVISELENCKTGSYKFILDESCYLSNYSNSPSSIEIDFDDGLGYRVVEFGNIIEVEYSIAENKNLRCKIIIDGEEKKGGTVINSSGEKAQDIVPNDVPWNDLIIPGASQYLIGTTGITNPTDIIYANAYTRIEGEFDKPFIFVEGIDFTEPFKNELRNGDFGWDEFASGTNVATEDVDYTFVNDMHFFLQDLIDEGYDIILLDFVDGATYIQDNASVLIELINRCNEYKIGDEPLVVAGASMGGQVARYALRHMEMNDMDHCTQVYLSLDSPHKGANIPIGLQLFVKIAKDNIGEELAGDVIDGILHRPASRQMLIDQMDAFYPNSPSLYDEYYSEITEMGLPQKTLNYAVSNGNNGGGFLISGTEHFLDYNCNSSSGSNLVNVILTIRGINSGQPVARYKELHPEIITVPIGIFGWTWFTMDNYPTFDYIDDDWSYDYNPNHSHLYDYCPGGTRNSFALLINKINDQLSVQDVCNQVQPGEYLLDHSFIPSVSALDIDLSHYSADIHLTTSELSQFDDTYSPSSGNQKHTQVDADEGGNLEWMLLKVLNNHSKLGNELTNADLNNGVFNIINPDAYLHDLTIYDGGELHINTYNYSNFAGASDVYPEVGAHIDIEPWSCSSYLTVGNNGKLRIGQSGDIPSVTATVNITDGFLLTVEDGGEMIVDSDSKLVIKRGGEVRIHGLARFAAHGKIIVEPGGRLIIDGGTVTSKTDEAWEGIEVQGSASLNQHVYQGDNQGVLIMKNNATVSNAECGVRLAKNEVLDGWDIDWSKTGGIIHASNSTFLNNRKDVEFLSYHNHDQNDNPIKNASRFYLCGFITDDDFFTDENISPNISMSGVDEIQIKGCVFEDQRTDIERHYKRDGIHSNSSSFFIDEYCPSSCMPCSNSSTCGIPSEFKNMRYGVQSSNHANPVFNIAIKKSKFDDCWKGVHLLNVMDAKILLNEFYITNSETIKGEVNGPVGLYMDNACDDYQIEENYFFGDDAQTGVSVGIVVYNGHQEGTKVYKNEFENLAYACETVGQNRSISEDDIAGLEFQCNDYIDNVFDIFVTDTYEQTAEIVGVREHQGELSFNDNTKFTNNTFVNSNNLEMNFENEGEPIFYNWNSNFPESGLIEYTITEPPVIEPVGYGSTGTNEACPTNIIEKTLVQKSLEKSVAFEGMNEVENTLSQLIDGGNTLTMEIEVIQTNNSDAWVKYQELMSNAGYLSNEVLKEVSKKDEGFTNGMIRNILVANPHAAKSKEVTKELDERLNPLPNYMRDQIKMGLTQISPKEYLDLERANYKTQYDNAIADALKIIAEDSLILNKTALIIEWMSNTNDIKWDYRLVEFYDENNMSEYADLLMDIMESDYELPTNRSEELTRFISYRNMINNWTQAGINLMELMPAEIAQLEDYSVGTDYAAAKAKGVLLFNYSSTYIPPVILPGNSNKNFTTFVGESNVYSQGVKLLEVSPNPSIDFFTVHYRIDQPFKDAIGYLMNSEGKIVKTIPITFEEDELLVPTQTLAKGNYQLILMLDGVVYLKESISIL